MTTTEVSPKSRRCNSWFFPLILAFFPVLAVEKPVFAQPSSARQEVVGQKDVTGKFTSRSQPWLQFSVPGHTSAVRVLGFAPDGKRLYSAGEDKTLRIWNREILSWEHAPESLATSDDGESTATQGHTAPEELGITWDSGWTEMRAIRWPVGRSYWGNIYAMAVGFDRILFGGHAASSHRKQLWAVDPEVGDFEFVKYPEEPSYHIIDIKLFLGETQAAVLLIDGTVELWEQQAEGWKVTRVISRPDGDQPAMSVFNNKDESEKYRNLLFGYRRTNTLHLLNDRYLFFSVLYRVNRAEQNLPVWRLRCFDIQTGQSQELSKDFPDAVSAVAVCQQTQVLAAADQRGGLFLWNFSSKVASRQPDHVLQEPVANPSVLPAHVASMTFSNDGRFLFGGTSKDSKGQAFLHRWDVTTRKLSQTRRLPEKVAACCISPTENILAFTQQNDIHIASADTLETQQQLSSPIRPVTRVAFARDSYKFAFGHDETAFFSTTFHPTTTTLEELTDETSKTWRASTGAMSAQWELHYDRSKNKYWIEKGGNQQVFAYLPLNPQEEIINYANFSTEKNLNAIFWISGRTGDIRYLVVGTSHPADELIVFDLSQKNRSQEVGIIRRYSGHTGAISSLSVSFDRKYLLSGSLDGTVRFWDISDMTEVDPVFCRWGMTVEPSRSGNSLLVTRIEETSPLFIRGVRTGSVIREIVTARPDGRRESITEAGAMIRFLAVECSWNSQTGFVIQLEPGVVQEFATSPSRREVASFFAVEQSDDFAFWTPSGYFTASANAPNFFGWLCNRGLRDKPEFVSAMAYKDILESRPIMQQLLSAGSLDKAMDQLNQLNNRAVREYVPKKVDYDLLFDDRPSIEIGFPRTPKELNADTIRVEANVVFHEQDDIGQPQMFINGIKAAVPDYQKTTTACDGKKQMDLIWDAFPLPSDPNILVKAVVKSEKSGIIVSSTERAVRHALKPPKRPKLYLLALGVDYTGIDSLFPPLEGVTGTVAKFQDDVLEWSQRMYDVETATLLNRDATLPNIRKTLRDFFSGKNGQIQPDDLVILYLAGHGTLDHRSGRYYFATFDTNYEDYNSGKFHNSLGFDELLPLSAIPCKRIIFLETCQFAPQELSDPMLDYRRLEDEQFILFTAAKPGESAIWTDNNTIGRFSKYLFNGWEGQADAFSTVRKRAIDELRDGKVTINELDDFIQEKLKEENRISSQKQQIAVFNKTLLRYIDIPLSEYDDSHLLEPGVRSIVAPRSLPDAGTLSE